MCTTCGCGDKGKFILAASTQTSNTLATNIFTLIEPEPSTQRINVEKSILSENKRIANENNVFFQRRNIRALNFVSSPGAGKTSLLEATIRQLKTEKTITVIEGDQQTSRDAERIRNAGARAIQINTGKGCHLNANMVQRALTELKPENGSYLFIENVGNLVCPANFELGEAARVAILSVTEGNDKPLKYPDIFQNTDLIIISKIDLLPYVDFDVEECKGFIRSINPAANIIELSVKTAEGMQAWLNWLSVRA